MVLWAPGVGPTTASVIWSQPAEFTGMLDSHNLIINVFIPLIINKYSFKISHMLLIYLIRDRIKQLGLLRQNGTIVYRTKQLTMMVAASLSCE